MKHIYITIFFLFLLLTVVNGQEYRTDFSSGKINVIGLDEIKIEGYNGSEVILTGIEDKQDEDDRAKGLKLINSKGLDDNTGMGISVTKEGDELTVYQISNDCHTSCTNDILTLKVPMDANLYVEHSTLHGDDVIISNISGEIEVSVNYSDVYLSDVTGPMAIKSVYGDVISEFSQLSQKGSISIHSVYGLVDATIPSNVKADVSLRTPYGSTYSNLDIEVDKNSGQSSTSIKGSINGGGVDLSIKASYDNIYLRTK